MPLFQIGDMQSAQPQEPKSLDGGIDSETIELLEQIPDGKLFSISLSHDHQGHASSFNFTQYDPFRISYALNFLHKIVFDYNLFN